MSKRLLAALAGVTTLAVATVVWAAPAAAATVAPAVDCTQSPAGPFASSPGHFTGQGVNIRTGPSTTCTVVGLGYEGQAVSVHCYYQVNPVWFYITDKATGVEGWSKYPLVKVNNVGVIAC